MLSRDVEHVLVGAAAVRNALVDGLEVVAVAAAASVREELAAAELFVEIEPRHISRTNSFVPFLRTGV